MKLPLVVIIAGPPCSGKTTLARQLSKELALPLIAKDDIKESLFDSLGWSDRVWSKKLGSATYTLMFKFCETLLTAGKSFIVESNFDPNTATQTFLALQSKFPFEPFQIQCLADGPVLVERFRIRAESRTRHPGHGDHLNYKELRPVLLKGRSDRLDLGGTVVEFDTTDSHRVNESHLVERIRMHLE